MHRTRPGTVPSEAMFSTLRGTAVAGLLAVALAAGGLLPSGGLSASRLLTETSSSS